MPRNPRSGAQRPCSYIRRVNLPQPPAWQLSERGMFHRGPPQMLAVTADAVFQAIRGTASDRYASLCQIIDRLIRAIDGVRCKEREKKVAHVKMKDRPDVFASRKHFQSDTQRRLYGTQGPASAVRRVEVSAIDATALVAPMEEHIARAEAKRGTA